MSYERTTIRDLYVPILSGNPDILAAAMGWAEAVNVEEVWEVVKKWFGFMQCGEAALKHPDPRWRHKAGRKPLDQEMADRLVFEMETDFAIEAGRFPKDSAGISHGPDFARLLPHARMAMAQELYDVIKTGPELAIDAAGYLARGESPWANGKPRTEGPNSG